jgi:chromosome segregation ATPase
MQEFRRPAEFRSAATQDLHVAIDGLHSEIAEAGDDWLDLASALRGELEEQGNRVAVQLRKMRALIKRIEAEQQEQRWRLVLLTHDVQRLGRSVGVAVSEPEVRS